MRIGSVMAEGKWMDKREERKDGRVGYGDMQGNGNGNGNGKTIRGLECSGAEPGERERF